MSIRLNPSWTDDVREPPGSGPQAVDAKGNAYYDLNLYQNCGPGATAVALAFWLNTAEKGLQQFDDHIAKTWWNDNHHQAYIMYLATKQIWPGQSGWPGEITYKGNGQSLGTLYSDMVNSLNWEADGENAHNGEWLNFYYAASFMNSGSGSKLHSEITSDVGIDQKPVIANVWSKDLPNSDWHGNAVGHSIAIVGYNDFTKMYTYIDTCGPECGGEYGPHDISQSQLLKAIVDDTADKQTLIW